MIRFSNQLTYIIAHIILPISQRIKTLKNQQEGLKFSYENLLYIRNSKLVGRKQTENDEKSFLKRQLFLIMFGETNGKSSNPRRKRAYFKNAHNVTNNRKLSERNISEYVHD